MGCFVFLVRDVGDGHEPIRCAHHPDDTNLGSESVLLVTVRDRLDVSKSGFHLAVMAIPQRRAWEHSHGPLTKCPHRELTWRPTRHGTDREASKRLLRRSWTRTNPAQRAHHLIADFAVALRGRSTWDCPSKDCPSKDATGSRRWLRGFIVEPTAGLQHRWARSRGPDRTAPIRRPPERSHAGRRCTRRRRRGGARTTRPANYLGS